MSRASHGLEGLLLLLGQPQLEAVLCCPGAGRGHQPLPAVRHRPPEPQAPYLPAWCGMSAGVRPGFGAKEVTVDEQERYCLVDLSVPGTQVMTVGPVTVTLDSGSAFTTMLASVAAKLRSK